MNIYQDIQILRHIRWNGHSMKWAFDEMWFDEMSRSHARPFCSSAGYDVHPSCRWHWIQTLLDKWVASRSKYLSISQSNCKGRNWIRIGNNRYNLGRQSSSCQWKTKDPTRSHKTKSTTRSPLHQNQPGSYSICDAHIQAGSVRWSTNASWSVLSPLTTTTCWLYAHLHEVWLRNCHQICLRHQTNFHQSKLLMAICITQTRSYFQTTEPLHNNLFKLALRFMCAEEPNLYSKMSVLCLNRMDILVVCTKLDLWLFALD